jgi:hypothetical protein
LRLDDVLRAVVFRAVLLRVGDFLAVGRDAGFFVRDFETCSGLPLRLVEANSSSCFSLIDLYMLRDAPLSLLGLVLPRLAESAAPAAFCCAADFAGMVNLLVTDTQTTNALLLRVFPRL